MRIAVNEAWLDKDGNEVKDTLFIDVTVWKKQAETCAKFLDKGSRCLVHGRLKYNKWETQDGVKRSKHLIIARQVVFLGKSSQEKIDEQDESKQSPQNTPNGTPPVEADQPESAPGPKDEEIPF